MNPQYSGEKTLADGTQIQHVNGLALGEPGLISWTGHVVETWAPNNGVLTGFSLTGRQTNICSVLRLTA